MDNSPRLCGNEWQDWANQLLEQRYSLADYQRVPDRTGGDAGIEGFTISEGHAYQAYGPEEPLTTDERYRKLRTKITTDVKKFIENKGKLSKLFGATKIQRWVLLVPYFDDKKIVEHAANQSKLVKRAKLPYVNARSFRVMVVGEESFAPERDKLLNSGLSSVALDIDRASESEIQDWQSKNKGEVATLDEKIGHLPTLKDDVARQKFRKLVLGYYLDGQNALTGLERYSEQYEMARKIKSEKERYLQMKSMTSSKPNNDLLNEVINEIKKELTEGARGLANSTVEALAYEATSDWLIRCPLDFFGK